MAKKETLPKLPYGQGSFSYHREKIQFRKRLEDINGNKVSKVVTCDTVRECLEEMNKIERNLIKQKAIENNKTLASAMYDWLNNIKKNTLKPQSFKRLQSTIKNQIDNNLIGGFPYQTIESNNIQDLLNDLNNEEFSHSTIKKTYDCLNDFYRYISAKDKIDNPMLLVTMPTVSNIKKETKTVEFFEQSDIDKFIEECSVKFKTGKLKYKYGYAIAANIYLGMRAGELLALQWKDIDFEKNTIYICKTLIEVNNLEYDEEQPELMKEKGIKKVKFVVQQSTKKSKNRYVPINSKAKDLLELHKQNSQFTEPDDYVISTSNRKTTTIKNLSDTIKAIEINAETDTQSSGTHVIRHTCASLYFRKKVPIEIICTILGNTREVCEKTYIHFIEEQLKEAASQIDVIEI